MSVWLVWYCLIRLVHGSLPAGEVYSGSSGDGTPERVDIRGDREVIWSIMRGGWSDKSLLRYRDTSYYAFSIEELYTVDNPTK